jgi:hypothetical protein
MLGWMILFALMVVFGMVLMLAGHPAAAAASGLFGLLFVAGLVTYMARGRAW